MRHGKVELAVAIEIAHCHRDWVPDRKLVAAPKVPLPLPSRTETVLEASFATARSSLPAPSHSRDRRPSAARRKSPV